MDCEKLNQDLGKLHALRNKMLSEVNSAADSNYGKQEFLAIQQELSSAFDSILEEYLSDFEAEYPKLPKWEFGERITGCNHKISTIVSLPNNQFMIGGERGEIKIFTKKDEKWEVSEVVEGTDKDIKIITPLSDNRFVVGGDDGELRILTKNGSIWELGNKIEGFYGKVNTIAQLSNGQLAVGGIMGDITIFNEKDGKWEPSETIEEFDESVNAIVPLSGNRFMAGGETESIKIFIKKGKNWKVSETIEEISDIVETIVPLSESQFVVGGFYGGIQILFYDDGKWGLGGGAIVFDGTAENFHIVKTSDGRLVACGEGHKPKVISKKGNMWFSSGETKGFDGQVEAIASLPNNQFAAGGAGGELRILAKSPLTVERVKQAIAEGEIA